MVENLFDELVKLPSREFEIRRHELIEEFIDRLPEKDQPRYRAMQWRIDQMRTKYKNPLVCTRQIFLEMWISFGVLREVLNGNISEYQKKSNIVDFKK